MISRVRAALLMGSFCLREPQRGPAGRGDHGGDADPVVRRPADRESRHGGHGLADPIVVGLDDVGVPDIKAGKIDPRVIGVLTKLSQEHKITVSCLCSDHPKPTAGGPGSSTFSGFQLARTPVLVTGAVLTAVLALAGDYVGGLVEEWLTPRGLD